MTVAELFTQTAQNLSQAPADMAEKEQARLVRAVNAGLGEFVDSLPGIRRRETKTVTLDLPLTKTITATTGSTQIAFSPTWTPQTDFLGRSVAIDTDPGRYNRLQSVNTLLAAYQGATGAAVMTLFSDATLLGPLENMVDGDVILSWGTGNKVLLYGKPEGWRREIPDMGFHTGEPQRWWVEGLDGMSGGANPQYVLRIWPQPAAAYVLVFDRRLWPVQVTTAMFASTVELPVLPREESTLVAACQRGVISSPLWIGSANKDDSMTEYAAAAAAMEKMRAERGVSKRGKILTRQGY